jgi:hypothetical protein
LRTGQLKPMPLGKHEPISRRRSAKTDLRTSRPTPVRCRDQARVSRLNQGDSNLKSTVRVNQRREEATAAPVSKNKRHPARFTPQQDASSSTTPISMQQRSAHHPGVLVPLRRPIFGTALPAPPGPQKPVNENPSIPRPTQNKTGRPLWHVSRGHPADRSAPPA